MRSQVKMEDERNILLDLRQQYYSKVFCVMEIVKCLQHKELAFITNKGEPKENRLNIRYLFSERYDYLMKHFSATGFFRRNLNIYRSVASFLPNKIPIFSYNLAKRLEEPAYKDFNENYNKYVADYDFLIDFDCKEYGSPADTMNDLSKIKAILDEFSLPYGIWNTSFKGFHFWIEGKWFEKSKTDWLKKRLMLFQEIAYNINGIYNIKGIDLSIFDNKRLAKCPYSFVGDGSICIPLDNLQFEQFFKNPQIVEVNNVLKTVFIKGRGLLIRNQNFTDKELMENTRQFVREFK